ncbi:trypsin-like peptidase [Pseudonocardia hierapolitana]|uniref:Trypsin-like peptidase n=1 Tax=Pseudonocardia hierapolitana TaxID=1128676 RepID=A0A561SM83_9PSEU|nr:trypsin-like peptidase domain-containing protein [Pseudonocardia hierapolitana]TWF75985.1 trypsin-like peptidase [Pseudonocardia hierapolitana]
MEPRTDEPVPEPTAAPALSRLARWAVAVAAALVVTACGAPAGDVVRPPHEVASPSERAAATLQPALVRITGTFTGWVHNQDGAYANGGRPFTYTATCTGFGVHPDGYVATAGHCVDTTGPGGAREPFIQAAAEQLVAAMPHLRLEDVIAHGRSTWSVQGRTADSPIVSEIRVSGIPGAPADGLPARVVDVRPLMEGDVALLKVESPNLPTLELSTGTDVPVGTQLLAAGYPRTVGELAGPDAQPSIKDGAVNGTQSVGSGSVYEISAALDHGMSGGPTVDHAGRVIGINSLRGSDTQPFNFVVPASGIAELLSRNGMRNEAGPRDLLYREALGAYYAGEYTDAIDALDRLLQEVPAHARAGKLRADAEAARGRHGDASENHRDQMLVWVSAGGGTVLLIVVVGAVLMTRRRRTKPAVYVPAPPASLAWPHAQGQWPGGPGAPFAAPAQQPVGAAGRPYHPYPPAPRGPARYGAAPAGIGPVRNGPPRNGPARNGPALVSPRDGATVVLRTPAAVAHPARPEPPAPADGRK